MTGRAKDGFRDGRSNSAGDDRLKGHLARVVVEANFELGKYSRAPKKIEANAEPFGETNRDDDLDIADLDGEIVNKSGTVAAVANEIICRRPLCQSMPMRAASPTVIMLIVAPESTKAQILWALMETGTMGMK